MSYISKFKYDTAYSNEDIQEALKVITGSGVAIGTPNEITGNVATEGVTFAYGQCAVTVSGNTATIATGSVIMPDGSYIIITEPETFEISVSGTYYVFIEEIAVGNNVPRCEIALPENEAAYILLATINNGIVADKRTYAQSKIDGYGGDFQAFVKLEEIPSGSSGFKKFNIPQIKINGFTYLVANVGDVAYSPVTYLLYADKYIAAGGISDNSGQYCDWNSGRCYISFSIIDNVLIITGHDGYLPSGTVYAF